MQQDDSSPYYMASNLTIRPQAIGGEPLIIPGAQHISASRLAMVAHHQAQAMVLENPEPAMLCTGYETVFGQYTFNPTHRDTGALILEVIPKYQTGVGDQQIKSNPSLTVIYLDDNHVVRYFNLDTYFKGSDGFGWMNRIPPQNSKWLRPGSSIPKEMVLAHSPAVQGSDYCLGTNLNVAFMTDQGVAEDACVFSESAAKKLLSKAICTMTVTIDPNTVPLNLYGDDTEDGYKFMPDIGEEVRDNGIVCMLRRAHDCTLISDMSDESLCEEQHLHDEPYYAPAGARILDIEVHQNLGCRKVKTPAKMFAQVDKYRQHLSRYYRAIINAYDRIRKEYSHVRFTVSPEFNTLVVRAKMMEKTEGRKGQNRKNPPKLARKGEPIQFIHLTITYCYDYNFMLGGKSTGREGAKGVCSQIRPDEDMPVDDYGFRADVIIAPEAVENRMNPSQLYEQDFNRTSEFIRREIVRLYELGQNTEAYQYLLDYIQEVNPNEALAIHRVVGDNPANQAKMVAAATRVVRLVTPPALDTIGPDLVRRLKEKYQFPTSPVTYNIRDMDGNLLREGVRSINNVCIGAKYIYFLCKIPHARSSGIGHINQFRVPVRNKKAKHQYPISQTPIRFGEDEDRNVTMCVSPEDVLRIMSLYANSTEGVNLLGEYLLTTDKPTQLQQVPITTEQLVKTNNMIKLGQHMVSTIGADIVNLAEGDEELIACPKK